MIVVDTNVISEIFRPKPDPRVISWIESVSVEAYVTTITIAELLAGAARLPRGSRKNTLNSGIRAVVDSHRSSQAVLSFDVVAAEQYAVILAAREAAGSPISTADAQIAAICRAHNALCATRNVKDFAHTGVKVVNPWDHSELED